MPSTIVPVPPFPNVPVAEGVPALLRAANTAYTIASTAVAIADIYSNPSPSNVWGIFNADGSQAIEPDSFLGIEFRKEQKVSDYPQEQGAFASYNKVVMPFDAIIKMACGGSIAARSSFLATLDSLQSSLNLLTVITPEVTYQSATIERYDYRREVHNGAGMIIASVMLREIRVTAQANYTQSGSQANSTAVQDPAATATQNQGSVQAAPITVPPPAYLMVPVQ